MKERTYKMFCDICGNEFKAWESGIPDYRLSTYYDENSVYLDDGTSRPTYMTTEHDICFECLKKTIVTREFFDDDGHICVEYKPRY